jgi:hypothetical protein
VRAQKEEYDLLGKQILRFPSRADTEAKLKDVTASLAEATAEEAGLTAELENKTKNFGLLFHALSLLAPDAYTPEPVTSTCTPVEMQEEEEGAVTIEEDESSAPVEMQDDE